MSRRWSLRVVSLLPSATEIVWALGARPELVGVSHECDHPAEVAERPPLSAPGGRGDGELDRSVRALLRVALAIYHLDVDLLAELDRDWSSPSPSRPPPPGPPVTATFPAEQVRWHPAVPA